MAPGAPALRGFAAHTKLALAALAVLFLVSCKEQVAIEPPGDAPVFPVRFDKSLSEQAQDGRLLLMLSSHDEK